MFCEVLIMQPIVYPVRLKEPAHVILRAII